MGFNRYARKVDLNQAEIVKALRAAGVMVAIIGRPVDLLTFYNGRFLPLELKSTKRTRKDQDAQKAFIEATGCPLVTTPLEALCAVGCST